MRQKGFALGYLTSLWEYVDVFIIMKYTGTLVYKKFLSVGSSKNEGHCTRVVDVTSIDIGRSSI